MSKETVKAVVVPTLTKEDIKLAAEIKIKLVKTAETIVEIGDMLIKVTSNKKGYMELFYKEIGMSPRSAQRYKQIANHAKVIELKKNNELEGKTMSDLIQIISPESKDIKNKDPKKIATGFFTKYKDNKEELEKIMDELQKLINE